MKALRSFKIVITTIFALTLLLGLAANFASAAGESYGYVQYNVNISGLGNSNFPASAVVNETVQPSGQSGFVDLTLALSASVGNFSYSRVVNSSSLPEIFPYLSGLTDQSLSYQYQGFSIHANLVNTGQASVTFNGTSYQATKYLVSFSASNSSTSFSGNGTIISLPSGLIENLSLSLNQTATVNATLLSTDLSLNAPASSIDPVGASLLGVAIAASVVVAAPVIIKKTSNSKHKTHHQENENSQENNEKYPDESKPSYEVD